MTGTDTSGTGWIAPSPAQFAELFPFHLIVDRSGRAVQLGQALAAIAPALTAGSALVEHVRVERPAGVGSLEQVTAETIRSLFILRLKAEGIMLRGQVIVIGSGELFMFIGSPWFTRPEEVQRLGLLSTAFPVHDATPDLLHAIQAQRMAAADQLRLVERLKQQRAELQQANALLRDRGAEASKLALVAARTRSAVVVADSLGRIEWVNPSFTQLTGYHLDEVVGKVPGHFLQGPETARDTVDFMRRKLASLEGFHTELVNYSKDGRQYWVEIEVQPVIGDTGQVSNFISIEQDVTARKGEEARRQLQQAVSVQVAEAESLEQGLLLVLRSLGKAVNACLGACWLVEKGILHPTPFRVWTAARYDRDPAGSGELKALRDRVSPLCRGGRPLFLEREPETRPLLMIPCRAEGRIVAQVILTGDRVVPPGSEMFRLLDSLGSLIGQFTVRTLGRRELQRSRDFAVQVMNLMGQGLTVTDEHGRFTFVNEAYVRAVGIPREQLIGKDPSEVSPAADQALLAEVRRARMQGKASSYEISLRRSDGEMMPVLVTGVPRMESGKFMGTIAVVTDITAQKRVENQFKLALARERELNTLKSSFVTMASHEFRTPLTGIVYAAEMMASHVKMLPESTGSRQRRYLDIILEGTQRMGNLMNDLLLMGRIEAGKLDCVPSEVTVNAFMEYLRIETGRGCERILVRVAAETPAEVMLDSNLLCHSLLNLLGNALKYSSAPAPVVFSIEVERAADGVCRLCFTVADEGCGIPMADQEKLFQPFFRATNVGKIRGTGIGLTIARDCARLHGGDLSFVSEVGRGTTFRLSVPLQVPDAAGGSATSAPESVS